MVAWDVSQQVQTMIEQLGAEVLEEFREEIKEFLRQQVKAELSNRFGCIGDWHEPDDAAGLMGCDSEELLYTYCFTRDNLPQLAAVEDIGGGAGCRPVVAGEVTAVVSPVREEEFAEAYLEQSLKDLNWVESKVRAHERVIEKVMASGTVVPLKFCTIFRGEHRVRDFIHKNQENLKMAFEGLQGAEEWGVKVFCPKAFFEPVPASEDIPATGANYLRSKQLAKKAGQEQQELLDQILSELFESLKVLALRWVVNGPLAKEFTGRDEDMVMNVVFLVDSRQVTGFCQTVEGFEAGVSNHGIVVEASGPWPPYHFVTFTEAAYD